MQTSKHALQDRPKGALGFSGEWSNSHPFGVAHPEASALTIGCSHLSASRRTTFLVNLRSRGVVAEDQLRSYLFTGTLRKYYVANRYLALSK